MNPKFATETRIDDHGKAILDRENKPGICYTDEIIDYKYSATILKGQFRKKSRPCDCQHTGSPDHEWKNLKKRQRQMPVWELTAKFAEKSDVL